MQEWEYMGVWVHMRGARVERVNGEDVRGTITVKSWDYFNQLGRQGWELAGVTNVPSGGEALTESAEYVFKRARQ